MPWSTRALPWPTAPAQEQLRLRHPENLKFVRPIGYRAAFEVQESTLSRALAQRTPRTHDLPGGTLRYARHLLPLYHIRAEAGRILGQIQKKKQVMPGVHHSKQHSVFGRFAAAQVEPKQGDNYCRKSFQTCPRRRT